MQLSLFQPPPSAPSRDTEPLYVSFRNGLTGKIPELALPLVIDWFVSHRVKLLITWGRTSKSGDFRPPRNGSLPVISVNNTLNTFAFLITLIHEMAHFLVYEQHHKSGFLKRKRRIQPHGKEWKETFIILMDPYLALPVFPDEIRKAVAAHMQNPRASTYSDPHLARLLLTFEAPVDGVLVEELPEGALFTTTSGMLFRKEVKLRSRYRCVRMKDRKIYLFSPLARVLPAAG